MNSDQADRSRQIDALIATLFGLDATLDVTSAVHQSRRHAIERFLALLARGEQALAGLPREPRCICRSYHERTGRHADGCPAVASVRGRQELSHAEQTGELVLDEPQAASAESPLTVINRVFNALLLEAPQAVVEDARQRVLDALVWRGAVDGVAAPPKVSSPSAAALLAQIAYELSCVRDEIEKPQAEWRWDEMQRVAPTLTLVERVRDLLRATRASDQGAGVASLGERPDECGQCGDAACRGINLATVCLECSSVGQLTTEQVDALMQKGAAVLAMGNAAGRRDFRKLLFDMLAGRAVRESPEPRPVFCTACGFQLHKSETNCPRCRAAAAPPSTGGPEQ